MAASSYPPARGALIDSSDKSPNRPLDKPSKRRKHGVQVENGSLSEDVPIAGTPFKLNYTSERTREGVSRGLRFKVQVGLDTIPNPAPTRVDVKVLVAGRTLSQTATIDTDSVSIDWDGKNAYDQQVSGATPAGIQVCYAFSAQYSPVPRTTTIAFGVPAASAPSPSIGTPVPSDRPEVTVCNSYQEQVTPYLSTGFGPDGWMLSAQDSFDATGRSEIMGNGQQISARGRALGYAIKDILLGQPGAETFDLDNTGFSGFVQLWDGGFIMMRRTDVPWHFLPNGSAFVADNSTYWNKNWSTLPAPLPGPGGTIYLHEVERLPSGAFRDEVRRYQLDQSDKVLQLGQVVATGFDPQASTSDGRLYGLTGAQAQQVAQITPDGTPNPAPKVIYTSTEIATDNTNTVAVGTHAVGTLVRNNWLTAAGEDEPLIWSSSGASRAV